MVAKMEIKYAVYPISITYIAGLDECTEDPIVYNVRNAFVKKGVLWVLPARDEAEWWFVPLTRIECVTGINPSDGDDFGV